MTVRTASECLTVTRVSSLPLTTSFISIESKCDIDVISVVSIEDNAQDETFNLLACEPDIAVSPVSPTSTSSLTQGHEKDAGENSRISFWLSDSQAERSETSFKEENVGDGPTPPCATLAIIDETKTVERVVRMPRNLAFLGARPVVDGDQSFGQVSGSPSSEYDETAEHNVRGNEQVDILNNPCAGIIATLETTRSSFDKEDQLGAPHLEKSTHKLLLGKQLSSLTHKVKRKSYYAFTEEQFGCDDTLAADGSIEMPEAVWKDDTPHQPIKECPSSRTSDVKSPTIANFARFIRANKSGSDETCPFFQLALYFNQDDKQLDDGCEFNSPEDVQPEKPPSNGTEIAREGMCRKSSHSDWGFHVRTHSSPRKMDETMPTESHRQQWGGARAGSRLGIEEIRGSSCNPQEAATHMSARAAMKPPTREKALKLSRKTASVAHEPDFTASGAIHAVMSSPEGNSRNDNERKASPSPLGPKYIPTPPGLGVSFKGKPPKKHDRTAAKPPTIPNSRGVRSQRCGAGNVPTTPMPCEIPTLRAGKTKVEIAAVSDRRSSCCKGSINTREASVGAGRRGSTANFATGEQPAARRGQGPAFMWRKKNKQAPSGGFDSRENPIHHRFSGFSVKLGNSSLGHKDIHIGHLFGSKLSPKSGNRLFKGRTKATPNLEKEFNESSPRDNITDDVYIKFVEDQARDSQVKKNRYSLLQMLSRAS